MATDSDALHGLELGESTFERSAKYQCLLRTLHKLCPNKPESQALRELEEVMVHTATLVDRGRLRPNTYADFSELLVSDGDAPHASAEGALANARKSFIWKLLDVCEPDNYQVYNYIWDNSVHEVEFFCKQRVTPVGSVGSMAAWLDVDARWSAVRSRLGRLLNDPNFIGERIKLGNPPASLKKFARVNELLAIQCRVNLLNGWGDFVRDGLRIDGLGLLNFTLPWNGKRILKLRRRPRAGQHHRNDQDSGEEEEDSAGRMSTRRAALYGQRGSARALLG